MDLGTPTKASTVKGSTVKGVSLGGVLVEGALTGGLLPTSKRRGFAGGSTRQGSTHRGLE